VLPLRGTALLQIQRIRLRQEAVAEERMDNRRLNTFWWQPGVKRVATASSYPAAATAFPTPETTAAGDQVVAAEPAPD